MEELLRFEHVSFAYEDGAEQRLALKDCSVSIGLRLSLGIQFLFRVILYLSSSS